MNSGKFNMIDNYIYLYHLKEFCVIPTFPDQLQDTMSTSFNQTNPMSRSAPIYSYSHSGPRSMQIVLNLHRDLMHDINHNVSNFVLAEGDDYVDTIIKKLQSAAVPSYNSSEKLVNPPQVAVRFGNDIFIKGVVTNGVSVSYELPILDNNKYAKVSISFNVSEVEPYDAQAIRQEGSFRGLDYTLERSIVRRANG